MTSVFLKKAALPAAAGLSYWLAATRLGAGRALALGLAVGSATAIDISVPDSPSAAVFDILTGPASILLKGPIDMLGIIGGSAAILMSSNKSTQAIGAMFVAPPVAQSIVDALNLAQAVDKTSAAASGAGRGLVKALRDSEAALSEALK